MNPEYDLGIPEAYAQMQADPGIPDELVAEILEEPAPPLTLQTEIAAELTPMLWAAVATMLLVELIKRRLSLSKLLKAKLWPASKREVVWNWLNIALSAGASQTFGFRAVVLDLTGVNLSYVWSLIYGTAVVSALTELLYRFRLTQMLKAALYKKFGVTDADVSGARAASEAVDTIDMDDLGEE